MPSRSKVTEITPEAVKALSLDDAGSAEVLPIDSLNVDPDYQRELRFDLVNKIANEYDIVKAGPILVSQRRDGSLWIVDGQHRVAGAQQAGETEVFAHVVHGLTKEKEAALRLARNDRRSDTVYERFNTRLVMGDRVAHAIVEIAHQFDTQINTVPNTVTGINAISAIETLYKLDGGVTLTRVLRAIKDAFGSVGGETTSVGILKGMTWFIARHIDSKEANYGEFIARIGQLGTKTINTQARAHKAGMGGSLWINVYRAMVEAYNFRRSDKHKLHWKTTGGMSTLGDDSTTGAHVREGLRRMQDKHDPQ